MARILILGGGFGGLAAAHEARRRLSNEHKITVIAESDRFFVGYAKLWDLVGFRGLDGGTGRLADLRNRGIEFVQARITSIDLDHRTVDTSAGRLDGAYLVIALGSVPRFTGSARPAGAAHNLYDPRALSAMRAALEEIAEGRVVISVLGLPYICPPAPYEAAFLVDELLRRRGVRERVDLVVTTPMPSTLPAAGDVISNRVAQALDRQNIELRTDTSVKSVDGEAQRLSLDSGETLDFSLLLGVPEAAPPAVVAECPLAGEDGWIWPDRYTCRTPIGGVYAVGDCVAVQNLPRAGVFAEAMGVVAGANVAAELTGGELERYDGTGYCFLEFPGQRASALEGEFFTDPPVLRMAEPSTAAFAQKESFETARLTQWLGVG